MHDSSDLGLGNRVKHYNTKDKADVAAMLIGWTTPLLIPFILPHGLLQPLSLIL